jgi:hypothetical protein
MQLPGITINAESRIIVRRTLPTAGEILVQRGQRVEALDIVARAELPRRYRVIDVARRLAQPKVDMRQVMLKAEGEPVKANETIATARGGLPFLQRSARAPAAGYIAVIGPGWILLEIERTTVEIQAFISGIVSKIIPQREVIIEANGAIIEAACGFGGEAYGRLHRLVDSPFTSLEAEALNASVKQTILVGGRSVDEAVLRQAEVMQVRGIIVGSIDASLLNLTPPVKVRVVATEGFGNLPMSPYTFGMLTALSGREVSIRGQTPILPPPNRETETDPPIILATTSYGSGSSAFPQSADDQQGRQIRVGSRVRITQGKLLGATGHIDSLPSEPQSTESGIVTPGAYVIIDDQVHYIPWANLEQVN